MKSLAAALFLAVSISPGAHAAPPVDYEREYSEGSTSYAAGNYKQAEAHYLTALKGQPTSWRIYYQLGNCFLQLKDASDAKTSYQSCLKLQPPADIRKNCEQVLSSLSQASEKLPVFDSSEAKGGATPPASGSKKQPPGGSGAAPPDDTAKAEAKPAAKDDWQAERDKQIEDHKERIMSEARKRADKIREDAKTALEDMKQSSGAYYRQSDGSLKLDVSQDTAANITGDAEKKAQAILDEARRRAAAVNSP